MTFEEAKKEIEEALDLINYEDMAHRIDEIIDSLKKEYAPTVEMTSGNEATFIKEGDSLSKLLTGYFGFDMLYWGDISERRVAQAWLHPETIVVIDSE